MIVIISMMMIMMLVIMMRMEISSERSTRMWGATLSQLYDYDDHHDNHDDHHDNNDDHGDREFDNYDDGDDGVGVGIHDDVDYIATNSKIVSYQYLLPLFLPWAVTPAGYQSTTDKNDNAMIMMIITISMMIIMIIMT